MKDISKNSREPNIGTEITRKQSTITIRDTNTPWTHEEELDVFLAPLLKQFILKNCSSANLGTLVKLCVEKSQEVQLATISNLTVEAPQLATLLLILRLICRHFLERMPVEALQRHLTMSHTPDTPDEETHVSSSGQLTNGEGAMYGRQAGGLKIESGVDTKLCRSLFSVICKIPLSNSTIALHNEAVSTLIILLSSRMYDERNADENAFYRNMVMKTSQSEANIITKRLFQNYLCPLAQNPENVPLKSSQSNFELASKLFTSLSPFNDGNSDQSSQFTCSKQFCEKSLLLVEILTNHCTQISSASSSNKRGLPEDCKMENYNPFRFAISNFVDFSLSASSSNGAKILGTDQNSSFSISFELLYLRLCQFLEEDQETLMFYMLLHKNSAFLNYVLTRSDIDRVLLPLLKVLYSPNNASSHHLYMILIILLILSEDTILNNVISEIVLPQVTWFSEKILTDISLSSIMVLVLLRTIQVNISQMKDKYLHTNCLATLANMSNHFQNLNPYCSQRLVALSNHLTKKQTKLNVKLTKLVNDEKTENLVRTELAVIEEILRLLLEVINNALTNQLSHNGSLVHCLIYDKDMLNTIRLNHNYQDIVYNLDIIVNYYLNKLSTSNESGSVSTCENILQFIKESSKVFPVSNLHKFPELKFRYCEEEAPEDFFIPYIWSIAYRNSGIFWNINFVTLFKFTD
ncbi:dymeclin-like isoform X2 [Convolutriloba macropyga]|uniref:dymeclin-like isoform X2 n=1 Tax=Convolutriloba macropyga TaxID=536237 RepID=UPI003F51CE80